MKPEPKAGATVDDVRLSAMRLLARREHSHRELAHKLAARGFPAGPVAEVLDALSGEGLLSDTRFAQEYVYGRSRRGVGPVRIRAELLERGVDESLVDALLAGQRDGLRDQVEQVRRKRFGQQLPRDVRERARQARFLQQRGFPMDMVNRVLGDRE